MYENISGNISNNLRIQTHSRTKHSWRHLWFGWLFKDAVHNWDDDCCFIQLQPQLK